MSNTDDKQCNQTVHKIQNFTHSEKNKLRYSEKEKKKENKNRKIIVYKLLIGTMMEEEKKPTFKSGYQAFWYEWHREHEYAIKRLNFIEIARRIAVEWANMSPADKVIYHEMAGITKTISQPAKKKKVTMQKMDDDYDYLKPGKKKSRSMSNISSAATDDSDDSDTFVQQKRKYRKRDKSYKNSDNDSHGNYGRRKSSRRDPNYGD